MSNTFIGLPINGDVIKIYPRPAQRLLEEFTPIMQAVLDDPTIAEFGWEQYTPHFNDGDECVFDVHEPIWFRTQDDEDVDDIWDLTMDGRHRTLGYKGSVWDRSEQKYVDRPYDGPDEARYNRCKAFATALQSGAFYDVLIEAFGDHADITVRKTGIDVAYCNHD